MLSIITSLAPNNAIGFQQKLLWKISEDMQYFQRITTGHCLIMGHNTFESIGKPLPNRRNIVISTMTSAPFPDIEIASSLPEALALALKPTSTTEIFVIGGGETFRQAFPLADKLYITHVHAPVDQADTYFPRIDWRQWKEISREDHDRGVDFPYPFSFVVYAFNQRQHNYNIDPFSNMYP